MRRGDMDEVKRLQEAVLEEGRRRTREFRESLRERGAEEVDLRMIELYELQEAAMEAYYAGQDATGEYEPPPITEHQREMAERMGRLPEAEDGRLEPEADRFSVRFGGYVSRNGLLIEMGGVDFVQPYAGAPALLEWLCDRGCREIFYEWMIFTGLEVEEALF